jgi:hypothetical protein
MKIKELLYKTPEMTEEKLLEIIDKTLPMMRNSTKDRIRELHKGEYNLAKAFLDEYDLIQDKKSYLTKSQREQITGFVGLCMIQMVKNNE